MENTRTPNGQQSTPAHHATLQQTAHDTLEQWQQKGEEVRAQLAPKVEAARVNAREWQSQATAGVRQRPWAAIAIAALAGVLVAKLLS